MQLLLPEGGLLFWMLVSFSIVFFVLKKYGFPYILKQEERRREFIEQALKNAREANEKLESINNTSQQLLREAQQQRMQILQQAQEESKRIVEQAHEEAEKWSKEQMRETEILLKEKREEALHQMKGEILFYAVSIAEQLLQQHISNSEEQMGLVDRLIKKQSFSPLQGTKQ